MLPECWLLTLILTENKNKYNAFLINNCCPEVTISIKSLHYFRVHRINLTFLLKRRFWMTFSYNILIKTYGVTSKTAIWFFQTTFHISAVVFKVQGCHLFVIFLFIQIMNNFGLLFKYSIVFIFINKLMILAQKSLYW
jgi:hypothetical protein